MWDMPGVPLAADVQQSFKTGHVLFFRLSLIWTALVFVVEKVMKIVVTEECETYFAWMTQFRQARPNLS